MLMLSELARNRAKIRTSRRIDDVHVDLRANVSYYEPLRPFLRDG
jgi:hypothetical protein